MSAVLEYPFAAPELGGAVPLADGIRWLRLPVPGGLKHINVWLLEDGDGWTLVDCGMDVPAARAAWDGPLARALAGRPIRRIVCTHHHPDHAGLAAWLASRHGAEVWMSATEAAILAALLGTENDPRLALARTEAFARQGLPMSEELRAITSLAGYRRIVSGLPPGIRTLAEGDELSAGGARWVVRIVRGHTDGLVLLHAPEAGLLISADQVLPRITSNVGIYPERDDPDPLASFLDSFPALAALEPEPLVLPSHGDVFRGLRARLDDLAAHHAATLAQVVALVPAPATALEVAGRLFRAALDPLNRMLAFGETLAHLEHLARRGRLRVEDRPGEPRRYGPA
ncbi:MAG: MBL fold metallo-hydrolase [Proteobacteria bacterium]|nr:MBL fold metallo-hydrolase [Pseudomonadota bacterium]